MSKFTILVRRSTMQGDGSAAAGDRKGWRLSVRSKFLLMMLLTSLLSLGTITWLAYQAGKTALTEAAVNQLTSIRAAKKQQVEHYFRSHRDSFRAIADAPIVGRALEEFTAAYRQLGRQQLTEKRKSALERYLSKDFLPQLNKLGNRQATFEEVWPASASTQELQAIFLVENRPGENDDQTSIGQKIGNDYGRVHDAYHRWFQGVSSRLGLYDVFLIEAQSGAIVYTVAKEPDLGHDMTRGMVASTNLGRLVREVMQSRRQGEARFADFAFYPPSFNVPAAFIAAPVFKDQAFIGVLAGQLSTEALNRFMHDGRRWREQGLGESGAVYLVGADMLMRSDNREIVEIPDRYIEQLRKSEVVPPAIADRIALHRTTVLHYPIQNEPVRNALRGRSGTDLIVNRRGFGAYLSYAPLDIPDLNWVVIARMDENEVLASQIRFNRNVMIAACLLALLATLAALWLAGIFLRPIRALLQGIERLKAGERGVQVRAGGNDEFSELATAFNAMSATIKQRDEVIEGKSRAHEQLLKRIFPEAVADRMRQGDTSVTESFPQVTAIYLIIDGFVAISEARGGTESIKILNEIVDRFDQVAEDLGVEKVKTIGDHYLAVSGLSIARLDHAQRALDFARAAQRELMLVSQASNLDLGLRAGIASGPAQAGLVGSRRFVYDIWGLATSAARRIVYDAELNSLRMNGEAFQSIADKTGIGEELVVRTKTLGAIRTFQIRFAVAALAKAAQ